MGEHELSGARLEQHEDGRDPGSTQQLSGSNELERELGRYEEEEVVTKPWPPQRW